MRVNIIIRLLIIYASAICVGHSQVIVGNFGVQYVAADPFGSCSSYAPIQVVVGTGLIYTCQSGTWAVVSGSGSGGTVTSVSGLSPLFTVNNPTTTPTFVLLPTIANSVFGNFTGSSAAPTFSSTPTFNGSNITGLTVSQVSGAAPLASPTFTGVVTLPTSLNGCLFATSGIVAATGSACGAGSGSGTVTSVGLTVPSWLTVAGSPITTSGTLAVTATTGQTANQFVATPNGTTGAVGLRSIVAADIPTLNQSTTGNAATATNFQTSITGIVKGNGLSAPSAAIAGTDYLTPTGNGSGLTALNASAIASGTVPSANLPTATTLALGAVKVDGTTITISSGTISAATSSGTVTHTTGALTANAVVIGNAAADIKVDTGCSTDGAGTMTCAGYNANAATPGSALLTAGTGSIPSLTANSAGFAAPVTGGTSYLFKLPATITAGVLHAAAPATGDGVLESNLTSSGIAIADLTATGTPSSATFLRGDNTWATPSSGITGSTNQVVRMSATNVAAGSSVFTDDGVSAVTYDATTLANQTTWTLGNTANTNGNLFKLNVNTNQSTRGFSITNQFGEGFGINADGSLVQGNGWQSLNGISNIVDKQVPINQYASHNPTLITGTSTVNMTTTALAGTYLACGSTNVGAGGGGGGTMALTFNYNNGSAQTIQATPATVNLNATNAVLDLGCHQIRVAGSSTISYTITVSGLIGSPSYTPDINIFRIAD